MIEEFEGLAAGRPDDAAVWREIGSLIRHSGAGRLRYEGSRCRGVPPGSGAIESPIRRVLDPRLKGTSLFREEANAEAVIPLRAAVLSGRWDERLEQTRVAMTKDRRTDGDGEPPECLAELNAPDEADEGSTQTSRKKQAQRTAA